MSARYYQTLLGVPAEIPAPDYFQLLGISADAFDEEALRQVLRDRLDRLDAAPEALRPMAQHLKRELQRARSTLMDPKRRAEYVAQLGEQRRRSIPAFVEALVIDGVLWDETERALLRRFAVLGLTAEDASGAVDGALESLGAQRGEGGGASEDDEVLERMHEVAGWQLLEAAGMDPPPVPVREARKAAPAERAPEPHFESEVSAPEVPSVQPEPEPVPVQEPEPPPVPEPEPEAPPVQEPEPEPRPVEEPEPGPIRRAKRKPEPTPMEAPSPPAPPRIKAPAAPSPPPPTERDSEGPIRRERRPNPAPEPEPAPVEAPTRLSEPGSDSRIPVSDPFGPTDSSGVIPIPELTRELAPASMPSDSSDEVPIPRLSQELAPASMPSESDEVPIPRLSPERAPAVQPSSGEVPVPDVNLDADESGERPERVGRVEPLKTDSSDSAPLDDSSDVAPAVPVEETPRAAEPVASWEVRAEPAPVEREPEPEPKRPPVSRPPVSRPSAPRPPAPRPPVPREKPVALAVPEAEPEPAPAPPPRRSAAPAASTPKSREPRPEKTRHAVAGVASREEEDMIDERERRGARRASRTWFALFIIAFAFVAGELVGVFVPDVSTSVESFTAPYRQKIVEIPDVRNYALGAAALGVLLLGLLVFLAGSERRRGFLILTFVFMLPVAYMGLIPLGRLRALIADRAGFDAKLNAATADRDKAAADRDKAAVDRDQTEKKAAADREQTEKKVAELEKRSAELEKRNAEQAEPLEALRKKLDEMVAVLDSSTRASEARRAKQDEVIDALRKELDELRKKQK